jgi:hypothetical protein
MKIIKYIASIFVILFIFFNFTFADSYLGITPERLARHQSAVTFPENQNVSVFPNDFAFTSAKISDLADLKISESVAPASFAQSFSSFVRLGTDRVLAIWQDDRQGNDKIFGQIYDISGTPISGNTLLASRTDGYNLIEPKATPDGSGGFFLGWRDEISGRIYVARYNSILTRMTAPFIVSDTASGHYAGPFDIDNYPDGRLVVVWEEYTPANIIALRIFNSSGTPLTAAIKVNSDNNDFPHWVPSLAVNKTGGMAVAWEDYRNGNADIFMRLVNQDGTFPASDFGLVEAAFDDSAQYLPQAAYSATDGFAVSWLDRRSGRQKVYLQRVVPGTGLVGTNAKISDSDSLSDDWDIALAIGSINQLNAAWSSAGADDKIYLRKFGTGFALGESIVLVNSFAVGHRWETSLLFGPSDKIFCGWTDYRLPSSDIYFELLSSTGVPQFGADKLVNDDSLGAHSIESDLALLGLQKGAIVFANARHDDGDIFLQLIGSGGLIGTNLKINSDTMPALQNEPTLAASGNKILTVWNDNRAVFGVSGRRIFGRYLNQDGIFSGADFSISNPDIISSKSNPAVAISRSQTALVAWSDNRSGAGHIMGQLVREPSNLVGNEFAISIPNIDYDNDNVTISRDSSDIFTIGWLARGSVPSPNAVIVRYTAAGSFLNRFTFNGNMAGVNITDMAMAINDSGDVFFLWQGTDTKKHLYLTIFSKTGTIKKASFEITDNINADPQEIDIAVDDNRYVIASWIDSRSGHRTAYYQIFNSRIIPVGSNTPASLTSADFMISPAVSVYPGVGWFVWADPRQDGLNIYLNRIPFSSTDIDDNEPNMIPSLFTLEQNYPNPFNPSTDIEFAVPSRCRVEIIIHNILGEKIDVLTDKIYEAGHYVIGWDGHDNAGRKAPSGIYLYLMKAGQFTSTKKMILLK